MTAGTTIKRDHAKQQAHRLTAPVGVLILPELVLAMLPLPPLALLLATEAEMLAPLEEADLSGTALPVAVRPGTERPTDTTWSGDVL